jgi:hypothetical protein
MLPRSLVLLGAVAALAGGAATAGAAPNSAITYVNEGNVYLMGPTGAGRHALTTDANRYSPYERPRVAADGTVWALKGWDIVHLSADGHRLGTITPKLPKDSDGVEPGVYPDWLDLSPDGTKFAYSIDNYRCEADGSCNKDGITAIIDVATGQTLSEQIGITEASFVDDQHVVGTEGLSEGTLRISTVSGPSVLWYRDSDVFGPTPRGTPQQPSFSPDRTQMASLRWLDGIGPAVFTYKVPAAAGAPSGYGNPVQLCVVNNSDPYEAQPTFSPDSKSLVVAQKDGLASYDLSAVTTPDECATKAKFTALADKGAVDPDWGVIPGTLPDPPAGGGGGAGGSPVGAGGAVTPAPASTPSPAAPAPKPAAKTTAARISVSAQRLSAIVKSGLKVKLSGLKAGRTTLVVKARGKVVARVKLTIPASGTVTRSIRLSATGRKALRKAKSATLTITAGGAATAVKVQR